MQTAGIVLCGGRSSRMGSSKAWLPVAGEPMLARVVRILGGVVSPVVVVAAEGQDLPALHADVRIVRDARPGRGPLEGLAAGMAAIDAEAAFVTSCDAPLLKPAFVEFVIGSLSNYDAAVPRISDRWQPLAAAYRIAPILRVTERLLAGGRTAVRDLFESIQVLALDRDAFRNVDPEFDSLQNANTPDEFAVLMRRIDAHAKT